MQNLYEELIVLLSSDDRLVSEGKLMKNKVIELALNLDESLLRLLLQNQSIKKTFFKAINELLIFDKISFQKFVSNKQFLPDSYTKFKNKIGLFENDQYIDDSNQVVLAWPYKDCLLEGGQDKDDAKRDEVFWNETLAPDQIDKLLSPKVLLKFKQFRADSKESQPVSELDNQNLVIKGNNLFGLHTIRKKFSQKVDLIYIDPPYNPESKANTFCYNNKFNRSTWLTFIKNRLDIAKELLTKDGVLIVAIDENEQAHLGVLLKEMFLEHEVHCITIVHNPRGVQGTNFSYVHEYAFFVIPKYKKSIGHRRIEEEDIKWRNLRDNGGESERKDAKNCFYGIVIENEKIIGYTDIVPNDIHPKQNESGDKPNQHIVYPIDPAGVERKWRYARQSIGEVEHLLRVKNVKNSYEIELGKDFGTYRTVWQDSKYDANEYGTKLIKALVPNCEFAFPKSLWNVYDCLHAVVANNKDAIILDFFGGSGTTAHAVLELNKDGGNRKFIIIEQMHYVESVTVPRIHQAMINNKSDSFVYCELAKANEQFVENIQNAENKNELSEIWIEMQKNAFLSYEIDINTINESKADFDALAIEEQKSFLLEILDKNMLYIPLSEIDDQSFSLSQELKELNRKFFN